MIDKEIMMARELKDSYGVLSQDYLRKKSKGWIDFIKFFEEIKWKNRDIVIDVGAGNARNLEIVSANHKIAFDLSYELLDGINGEGDIQRVAGSLPTLPFRKKVTDSVLMIAVLHHLSNHHLRQETMKSVSQILTRDGEIIFSVWRKWRSGVKEKIFEAIRNKQDPVDLYNVQLPWHDSHGKVIATRFYHYFIYQELILLMGKSNLLITRRNIMGGRRGDANFFLHLKKR
jgi:SAM-dependent methyltransferase